MTFQTQFHDGQVIGKNPRDEPAVKKVLPQIQLDKPSFSKPLLPQEPSHLQSQPPWWPSPPAPECQTAALCLSCHERGFPAWAPGITHAAFPPSCTPYHFSEMKRRRAGDQEELRTLPAAAAVSMAHSPLLSVTPADPPYELVSRNVSLLGVWRRETVLMPAPHTEDFISFLIFCLGAPAASNFPQLGRPVEYVASLGPVSVPAGFLTTWETSGLPLQLRLWNTDTLSLVSDCCGSRSSCLTKKLSWGRFLA